MSTETRRSPTMPSESYLLVYLFVFAAVIVISALVIVCIKGTEMCNTISAWLTLTPSDMEIFKGVLP
jgi:hypothetical protein